MLEISDCLANPGFKVNFRSPSQETPRPSDVGLPHFWIIHRKRLKNDLRVRSGDGEDPFGKVLNRHLFRIPDVYRFGVLR